MKKSDKPAKVRNPFGELLGLHIIKAGGGNSRCELEITEQLLNPHRVAHGAVIYAMADTGMGAALYPLLGEDELCATVEIKITYFAPVPSGLLACDTVVISKSRRLAALESEIKQDGKLIAKATGTFAVYRAGGTA
ncbi:MAG TPA: PaaI family thioesterase [Chitinophagales bacterium]|nr:PaaI family thioesterase [Chitinophagales bacterium]